MSARAAVIIPTKNRRDLLDATLSSLAHQDVEDFETVVADHGSTDTTEATVSSWASALNLTYVRLEALARSPGWVRDEGVRHSSAAILIFLDNGMIAPSTFVRAHRAYHEGGNDRRPNFGIGMCHGYRLFGRQPACSPELFSTHSAAALKEIIEADEELRDERFGIRDLEPLRVPWLYGWSGNFSVRKQLYDEAGGYDRERYHLYEDLDLAYRLHACGARFGVVDEGWAVHLPHPVDPMAKRMLSIALGWRRSYWRHRSLALEAAWLTKPSPKNWHRSVAEYGVRCDAMIRSLESMVAGTPVINITQAGLGLAGPTLLVGGDGRYAGKFDFVACGRQDLVSRDGVWGCAGVLIPMDDASLETVVVTEFWRRLGAAAGQLRLLDHLINEVKRVADKAVFVDRGDDRPGDLTRHDVIMACRRRGLPCRII